MQQFRPETQQNFEEDELETHFMEALTPQELFAKMEANKLTMEEKGYAEVVRKTIGRNDLCPCGSGKKFKKCHLGRLESLNKG